MYYTLLATVVLILGQAESLDSGDHKRTITVDALKRSHWIHVPPGYDAKKPMPVVLVLHGAMMDAKLMESFCDLNKTADKNRFITVYPNGTGALFQTWNAGVFPGDLNKNHRADDVKYLGKVLDDTAGCLNVDNKRIYVAGLSNGGMMAYRLASELSDRIAAIAAVAGTMAIEKYEPKRAVPVLHFHGTKDTLVPFERPENKKWTPAYLRFLSVPETIQACVTQNGCATEPKESEVEMAADKLKVTRKQYANVKNGAEVVLYIIENGGHTWPGKPFSPPFLGLCTRNISANDIMWDFFKQHELK